MFYQTFNQVSDQREKGTIAVLDYGLEKILSLKTYSYNDITDELDTKNWFYSTGSSRRST